MSILGYLGITNKLQFLVTQPLKCMLLDNDYEPDLGEDASIHDIEEYQVVHDDYPEGGLMVENLVLDPTGNGWKITCNDILFQNANFACYYAVIYNEADSQIIDIISFKDDEGNPKMVEASGSPLTIQPNGNALLSFTINNICPGGE